MMIFIHYFRILDQVRLFIDQVCGLLGSIIAAMARVSVLGGVMQQTDETCMLIAALYTCPH